MDSQRMYYAELGKAMRMYIQEHQSEFVPEGVDPIAISPMEPEALFEMDPMLAMYTGSLFSDEIARKTREYERNMYNLQRAFDIFRGAYAVQAVQRSMSTTTVSIFIVILAMSDWMYRIVVQREDLGVRKEMPMTKDRMI